MSNELTAQQNQQSGGEQWQPLPSAPLPANDGREPVARNVGLRLAWDAIVRWKWLVLAVSLTGIGASGWLVWRMPPVYLAQATLWVEPHDARGGRSEAGPIGSGGELMTSAAWIDLLKSYTVLDQVVERLGLEIRPGSPRAAQALATFRLKAHFHAGHYRFQISADGRGFTLSERGGVFTQRAAFGDSAGAGLGFIWVPSKGVLSPGEAIDFDVLALRGEAALLADRLAVTANADRLSIMKLELTGSDPLRTTATLNAIMDRYVEVAAELKRSKREELTTILQEQLSKAEASLRDAESSLEGFRVNTITLPSDRAAPVAPGLEITRDPVFANYFTLQTERDQIRRDREEIRRVLADAGPDSSGVEALEVVPSVTHDSELMSQLQALTAKRSELRALRLRYTEEHPLVRRQAAEIESLEGQVIPRLARRLMRELDARDSSLGALIASASSSLRQIPPRAIEEARLQRQVGIAGQLYTTLQQRYEEARLAAISTLPDVSILDRAAVQETPISRKQQLRLLLMGIVGSVSFALALAQLLRHLDRRLRYPEQVGEHTGLAILGTIPHLSTHRRRGLADGDATEALEAFRTVRLSLTHACGTAPPLIATITSPGSGDGKSFIATNLALAFAAVGQRTILLDGDTRRGTVHQLLRDRSAPGLSEYLAGAVSADDILRSTRFDNLDMIARGSGSGGAPEGLASHRLVQLMAQLRARYSVILVDSPPLGAGADAYMLGTVTGNLLLILRTGQTDLDFTEAKLEPLARLPVRIVGAIMNDLPANGAYRYYRYLSGYEDGAPKAVLAAARE